MNLEPKLLVCWEPRWKSFTSSLAPALARSHRRLGSECGGLATSPRSLGWSLCGHCLLLAPGAMRPRVVIEKSSTPDQITYYSGPYLPEIKDASGAEAGRNGRSGGNEGFHPKQIIRVSRGRAVDDRNIDAPKLRPTESSALANLIAVASAAPAPPAEAISKRLPQESQLMAAVSEAVPPPVEIPQTKMAEVRAAPSIPEVIQPIQEKVVRDTLSISKMILPEADVVQPTPDLAKLRSRQPVPTQELVSAAVPPTPKIEQVTHGHPNISALDVAAVQPAPAM